MECVRFSILLLLRAKLSFHIVFGHFNLIFYKFQIKCKYIVQQYFQFHTSYDF